MRLLFIILLFTVQANATTYYYSAAGSGNALSSSTPGNLADLNAATKSGVHTYLLKAGDTFTGSLTIAQSGTSGSPIRIGRYGTGANPVITGLTTVTGWTNLGGGLYEKTLSSYPTNSLNIVLLDGQIRAMGRLPKANLGNNSYYYISSFTTDSSRWSNSNGTITSTSLAGDANYTGAEIVQRTYQWMYDRVTITAHSGSTITYASHVAPDHPTISYAPWIGHGFFLQNLPAFCTQDGEWSYNQTTKKLTMFFATGSPATRTVQVSTADNLLTLASNYISISDVDFKGANESLLYLNNGDYNTFTNCNFSFAGINGIDVNRATATSTIGNTIASCTIRNALNNAINAVESVSWTIRNTTIDSAGMIVGAGLSGDGAYCGIYKISSNSLVEYNTVSNLGYNGIWWVGDSTIVQYNHVYNFCMKKSDGGGIYTYANTGANRIVRYNFVRDGPGNRDGMSEADNPTSLQAHGIYMDSRSGYTDIYGNVLFGNGGSGIFLGSNSYLNVTYNTSYNNNTAQAKGVTNEANYVNINFTGNILFSLRPISLVASFNDINSTSLSTFTSNSNVFARPISEPANIDAANGYSIIPFSWDTYHDNGIIEKGNKFYSLDKWQALTGKDLLTTKTYATISSQAKVRFEYNATPATVTVSLDSSYYDVYGNVVSSLVLQPYTSKILLNPFPKVANQVIFYGIIEIPH